MTQRLIIIMPSAKGGPGLWGRTDGAKLITHGRNAPPANDGVREIVAVLPGQSVRIYPHELPATSRRDRLRAAGFSLEDKIAASLDSVHLALDDAHIAVIGHAEMQGFLDQLKEAGLTPTKVIADFDAVSGLEGPIRLLGRIVTPGTLGHAVDAAWSDEKDVQPISDEDILAAIAARLESGGELNLMQNGFSAKTGLDLNWRKFAGLGGLAAGIGFAALILHGAETRALRLQTADLKIQTAQIYAEATGRAAPANPALAATRALKSGRQDNLDFLRLSQILFDGVAQIEGLSVDQLRYQDARKELQLRLVYPSFESAAELEAAILAAGGRLTTGGVREQSGEFVGDALLQGGA